MEMIKGIVAGIVSLDALHLYLPSVMCRTHDRRAWSRSLLHVPLCAAQVDKKCLMTSSEAAAANSRMPKGFKYMPVQPARKSSRPGSSKGGRT